MPRGGVHDKDRFVLLQFATWQYFIKKPNRFIIIILCVYCNVLVDNANGRRNIPGNGIIMQKGINYGPTGVLLLPVLSTAAAMEYDSEGALSRGVLT